MIRKSEKNNDFILNIDLESQRIWDTEEEISEYFEIEKFRKHCLQNGLDDIGLTLEKEKEIKKNKIDLENQAKHRIKHWRYYQKQLRFFT